VPRKRKGSTIEARVLDYLQEQEGTDAYWLCGPLGLSRASVRRALHRLRRKGLAEVYYGVMGWSWFRSPRKGPNSAA
jgi:predicted ArsR family transcriptional regulator